MKKLLFLSLLLASGAYAVMTDLDGYVFFPPDNLGLDATGASFAFTNTTLDADFEKIAVVFQNVSTQPIAGIQFRLGTITTGGTLDIRLETVTLDGAINTVAGLPTGTLYCGNTSSTSYALGAGDDNIWTNTATFQSACSVTEGDYYGLVIARQTGDTFNGAVSLSLSVSESNFSYVASSNSTAGWSKGIALPNIAVVLADGSYQQIYGTTAYDIITATTTGANMKMVGNKCIPPVKMRVRGFKGIFDLDNGPMKVSLYRGAAEVASVTMATGTRTSQNGTLMHYMFVGTGTVFNAGEPFYIVASTTAGVGSANMFVFQSTNASYASNLYSKLYPAGDNVSLVQVRTTVTSESSFVERTKQRLGLWAVYDQLDSSSGGTSIKMGIGP